MLVIVVMESVREEEEEVGGGMLCFLLGAPLAALPWLSRVAISEAIHNTSISGESSHKELKYTMQIQAPVEPVHRPPP